MRSSRVRTVVSWMSLIVVLVLAGGLSLAGEQARSVKVTDLRCEYLTDPLGIDVPQPRLSWKLVAVDPQARGQKQTAYQIVVASTMALLDSGQPDLWYSQVVASDQSVHVVYRGKPLASGMECFWRVRVKDEKGVSSVSLTARWTIGLLEKSDWTGKWIGTDQLFNREKGFPPPDNKVPDPWPAQDVRAHGQAPAGHGLRRLGRLS